MAKSFGPGFSFRTRGSVGRVQFRKVKRDNIVCFNRGGVRVVSPSQAAHRAYMSALVALWRTLSGVQLGAWCSYGSAFNAMYGGFAYFTVINMPLARAGSPLLSWPPGTPFSWASQYPPAQSDTYVKATGAVVGYEPYYATNPTKSLIGPPVPACSWMVAAVTNQRFHIDLGSAKTIERIYYENFHYSGIVPYQKRGVKNFTFWGSNSAVAFADLVYGHDTDWTQISTNDLFFQKHPDVDAPDPHYIIATNTTAYRYYAFKFADNWGDGSYLGVRRIELQLKVYAP